jgi:predicted ATP-dependent endonuclease of OLD family
MVLKRIEIRGLRGFENEGIINLANPDGTYGSGLTILVGPNNSGKSTIIEAFSALSSSFSETFKNPSFTEEMRNKKDDTILIRAIDLSDGSFEISNYSSLRSETGAMNYGFLRKDKDIFVLPSRRAFDPYYQGNPFEASHRTNYIDQMELSPNRGRKLSLFFSRISKAEQRKEEFDKIMSEVLDPLPKWEIDRNGSGQYYMKFIYDGISHISDGVGDGLLSIFFIVDALYDSNENEMIVIDEPELSLHPLLQKKLSKLFAEYARNRQIIIATHSPYFIDWDAIFNGANIIRVIKEGRKSIVYPKEKISGDIRKALKGLMNDTHNPHVLGLDSKEIFFLDDKIILVEGQEDVIYYKKILNDLNKKLDGEFYGWGVGGAEKMNLIAQLLNELGYKKVIGILDGDKETEKESLQKKFPDYRFFCTPADDLRTKIERTIHAKKGLLDENYRIRSEYKDDVRKLFDSIESELARSL